MAGETISFVGSARKVNKGVIVICELWDVPGHSAVNMLGVVIILEVFVVSVHRDGVLGTDK